MRLVLAAVWLASCGPVSRVQDAGSPPAVDAEVEADIRRYVRSLGSTNAAVSMDAVDYLPYFGRAAVPALVEALGDANANARGFAAAALARIPDARAVPGLVALVEDKAPLQLFVLSEDGSERHPAYDNAAYTVAQQAGQALAAVTGKRFKSRAEWDAWWRESGASFSAPEPEPLVPAIALPPHARWLRGVKVCIDPGHGGDMHKRGYKRGPTYLSEAETNLRVCRFLRDLLVQAGATVVMTRASDRDIDLKARAELAAGCDLFLSVHHNWSPSLEAQGTTTWHHKSQDVKPASVDLARYVQEETVRAVDPRDVPRAGGLMSDQLMYENGFGVLRQLPDDVPGCLVETTYYSNLAMERRLRDIDFNRREAHGMFLGLAKYLYYGVPRAEIVKAGPSLVTLQVFDGLEGRGQWSKPYRILSDFIRVRVDGAVVPHAYRAGEGQIDVAGPFASGAHVVVVDLINIHKNHSWPKRLTFGVE